MAILFLSASASSLGASAWAPSLTPLKRAAQVPDVLGKPVSAPQAVSVEASGAGVISEDDLFSDLSQSVIVYAGEQHNLPLHHRVQASVLKGMHARGGGLVVGLEMIDVTQQGKLDDYLSGALSEDEFAAFWNKAWGYDFKIYRPILEYARANAIPLRALNAPSAIIRTISRKGIAALTPEERAILPATIHPIKDERYLKYVKASLGGHGPVPPDQMKRMLVAMQAWNETMGVSALKAVEEHGRLLVIAGSGHMLYRAGIAESVRRRSAVSQKILLPYGEEGKTLDELLRELQKPDSADIELADYFWLLPSALTAPRTSLIAQNITRRLFL